MITESSNSFLLDVLYLHLFIAGLVFSINFATINRVIAAYKIFA